MLANTKKNEYFNSQVWVRMIPNNYFSIMIIYHPSINYSKYGNNIRSSMLPLIKDNSVLIDKKHQENINNNSVCTIGNLQQFS